MLSFIRFLALIVAVQVPNHAAFAADREVVWTKRAANSGQAQDAQEDFLLTLFNTGRLPFKQVPMGDSIRLEDVMRANGAWVGPMTEQIATLLCKMNRNRCDLTPSDANVGKDVQSVGGTFARPINWRVQPTDMVTIPDVRILQISRPEPADPNAIVESFGYDINRACLTETVCFDDYVIDADMPTGRLRDVVVATSGRNKTGFPLQLVPHLAATVNVSESPLPSYDQIQTTAEPDFDFSDTQFQRFNERLSKDIIAPLQLQLESSHASGPLSNFAAEPLASHQQFLLDSFCNIAVHGKCPEFDMNAMLPFVIGVIDQVPDFHCDFEDNIRVLDLDSATGSANPIVTTTVPDCEDDVRPDSLVQRKHHGTHVLGLLAARQNARGVGGLLGDVPNLSYLVIPFDETDDLQGDPAFAIRLADSIRRAIVDEGVRIFNFSSSYRLADDGGRDPVRDIIEEWTPVLFVAAAGKHGENAEGGICPARPACYARSLRNVIGVVGLETGVDGVQLLKDDNDPNEFRTNYGASTFSLGAPARDIISTIDKGAFGPMTGTSQAAPQITAAAALLMQRENLSPAKTRERLVFSSRLSTEAVTLLQGGAIDASAALLKRDFIRLANGCVLVGEVRNFKRHDGQTWHDGSFDLKFLENEAVLSKSVSEMRRMHWGGNEGIFFFANGDRIDRAFAGFDTNPDEHRIHIKPDFVSPTCNGEFDDGVAEVQLSRVVDFIASAR